MNPTSEALVLVAYGGHGVVQIGAEAPLRCVFRRSVGRPCCGDHVLISKADEKTWVVEKILARRNQFMRADSRGRPQVIAANLDQVIIVLALAPLPSRDLLDRYLVAVHSLNIEPLIVVNKAELPLDESHAGAATLQRLDEYRSLGYTVADTSCKGPPGVDALRAEISGSTSILVGQSGVGKSSLIRRLLPDLDIQTGALSRVTGKGTHTTTTTMVYHLPDGGHLIDSPGVWEYGLWELDLPTLAAGYREFQDFAGQCRFNDCTHRSEPSCAIKNAVDEGIIHPWRHAAYCRLVEQNKD
jgi:ribosome biogenesis GTPase